MTAVSGISPVLVLSLAALAGGIGAVLRLVVDTVVQQVLTRRRARSLPVGILLVNVTGSFALGILTGALAATDPVLTILGTGLLGGYTTFSTAMVDVVRLLRERRGGAALVIALGTLVLSAAAAFGGLAAGTTLAG